MAILEGEGSSMHSPLELLGVDPDYLREATRYAARGRVTIMRGDIQRSPGDLINISAGGAAFRAYEILEIGAGYSVAIDGFGTFECRIVRRFSGTSYGVEFDLDTDTKRRLQKRLEALCAGRPTALPPVGAESRPRES
jgi:hypothetical protein